MPLPSGSAHLEKFYQGSVPVDHHGESMFEVIACRGEDFVYNALLLIFEERFERIGEWQSVIESADVFTNPLLQTGLEFTQYCSDRLRPFQICQRPPTNCVHPYKGSRT